MSKSAEAFRTISEVAEVLETPAHVLRFWESRFTQIKPVKRAGGRRYYRPADVALIGGIRKLLHEDGLTIRGVQKLLREHGVRHVAALSGADFDSAPSASADPVEAAQAEPAPVPAPAADAQPDTILRRGPGDPQSDLFAPAGQPAAPRGFTAPLPDTAPGVEARAGLQRDREASGQLQTPAERVGRHDPQPLDDASLPAAALLRAMTALRAGRRRRELRAIYYKLAALHRRRLDLGHSAKD